MKANVRAKAVKRVKKKCQFCQREDNQFVLMNDNTRFTGIEVSMNRLSVLRVRAYDIATDQQGHNLITSQDTLNMNYCPACGRKFNIPKLVKKDEDETAPEETPKEDNPQEETT